MLMGLDTHCFYRTYTDYYLVLKIKIIGTGTGIITATFTQTVSSSAGAAKHRSDCLSTAQLRLVVCVYGGCK